MAINREFFFDHCRLYLFEGRLMKAQALGLSQILDRWESAMAAADDRWLAYMLATVHHETGRAFAPLREAFADNDDTAIRRLNAAWKAGRLPWVSKPYWERDVRGKCWLGRGYVQLTHRYNYEAFERRLNVGLLEDPSLAMRNDIALDILFIGMVEGVFTGKGLKVFFNEGRADWHNARRIINGVDKAALVASYGKAYYAALSYTVE